MRSTHVPAHSRAESGSAILVLVCAAVLVVARGAVRDWAVFSVACAHAAPFCAAGRCRCSPLVARGARGPGAHAAAMAGLAAAALIGGASDGGWTSVPWDSQVRVGVELPRARRCARSASVTSLRESRLTCMSSLAARTAPCPSRARLVPRRVRHESLRARGGRRLRRCQRRRARNSVGQHHGPELRVNVRLRPGPPSAARGSCCRGRGQRKGDRCTVFGAGARRHGAGGCAYGAGRNGRLTGPRGGGQRDARRGAWYARFVAGAA